MERESHDRGDRCLFCRASLSFSRALTGAEPGDARARLVRRARAVSAVEEMALGVFVSLALSKIVTCLDAPRLIGVHGDLWGVEGRAATSACLFSEASIGSSVARAPRWHRRDPTNPADGSNSAWWGFRRDEVASEASTEGGESGASSVAPSTCSEQPNVATLSRGNVCGVCGDDLPSRTTVCAACWFKKWQAVASLGHFSKPGRGESKKNKVAPEPERRIPRRPRRPHRAVPTSK